MCADIIEEFLNATETNYQYINTQTYLTWAWGIPDLSPFYIKIEIVHFCAKPMIHSNDDFGSVYALYLNIFLNNDNTITTGN